MDGQLLLDCCPILRRLLMLLRIAVAVVAAAGCTIGAIVLVAAAACDAKIMERRVLVKPQEGARGNLLLVELYVEYW